MTAQTPTRRRMLASLLGAGCVPALSAFATPLRAAGPVAQVVATTGMIGDTASVIGGAAVEVRALMGAGVDPHAYRQTRTDILALTRADLVLWHGLYLEAQMEEFLLRLADRQPVRAVAETVPKDRLLGHEDYAARKDPHIWMDPRLWSLASAEITEALSALVPDAAEGIASRAETFQQDLVALHDYSQDALSGVPAERRVLVTAHDAFRYFGVAYDFEVLGIQGISTESEAGLARIAELVELLVARRIGAVFVESSVSDRNIRALIEGAAARGHEVRVGGELYSDAMGPAGSYEGSYLGMIDHNVTTIAAALGGTPPDRGRLGRLSVGF
ncbi:metal ABC transporter solute-binding protein, Zn/Mn family [Oceanibium sediminis]|uniref:metal ABC transporter solute-binding protein, Zn/Mn family n=1 Tax=Oceanibium sediminis TaxID=2026339 RepID=UPI000DD39AD1|nr:zinc ABC transporter substrate-binding protein [Oceanibium sediminis]